MVSFYKRRDIKTGDSPSPSGHKVYFSKYVPEDKDIIYKENKHGEAKYSRLEVSFNQLAKLFLSKDLTPSQCLVFDDEGNVTGLAVENLRYMIANKEKVANRNAPAVEVKKGRKRKKVEKGKEGEHFLANIGNEEHKFYELKTPEDKANCILTSKTVNFQDEIPFYFLDKLPQGFFAKLVEEEKKDSLKIDYESLASVLVTSYTLEEDDIHKGNYGFYIVLKDGKRQVSFFKIDPDLMFVDSIMSFETRRPFHLLHGHGAFDIKAEDILSFPNLKHSSNSYWPTKFGYVANPFDNKEYHSYADKAAFTSLETNPEFVKGKWKAFYKHSLMPIKLVEKTLIDCCGKKNPSDRAHVALMTQAMAARLANLRAVLYSTIEFRDFIAELPVEEHKALLREIFPNHSSKQINNALRPIDIKIEEGDTPLHVAIRLGEYRYEDTLRMFGQFINTKNKEGQTPLDVALEVWNSEPKKRAICKNMRFIMQHLLENGATKTDNYKDSKIDAKIKNYAFTNPYVKKITKKTSYKAFKNILRNIGEDHQFCLKFKKNLAIESINHWIDINKDTPNFYKDLKQLKKDVNGESSADDCAGIKYLRQLRSKLWIIRQFRGLYGVSTTQTEINTLIDPVLERLKPKEERCFSFFGGNKKKSVDAKEPNIDSPDLDASLTP